MTCPTKWLVCLAVLWALGRLLGTPVQAAAFSLHHIHGLHYSADGQQLLIPMHHGLAIYRHNQWSKAFGPEHDYMGFSITHNAFYSSGHPAPGSPLKNPLGLLKSSDGGQTWEQLGLMGEADFHLLATSYRTNTVYVFNPGANSRMPHTGLYSTTTDGKHWRPAKLQGVVGNPESLAVHPTQDHVVAVGTRSGVFLSQNAGETFQRLKDAPQVYAVCFAMDEQHLWFSSVAEKPALTRLQWHTGQANTLELPTLGQDTVIYIANNPVRPQEWAIATYKRDVYLSADSGKTWKQIAKQGVTLS